MNRKICPIEKKTLNLQLLSWKQSFYLKKTNTYWRYRAIACEGHRFIFCMIHTTSYCKSHMPAPWAQCLLSLIGITFLLLARHTQMSCQTPIISELSIAVPRFLAKSHYYFHLFYRQIIISFYINPLNHNFFNHFLYFLFYFAYLCKYFTIKVDFCLQLHIYMNSINSIILWLKNYF